MAHELYQQLQQAYDFLNLELFADRLPRCIITVQRENECVHGYFSKNRFASKSGDIQVDEIALNPIYFVNNQIENVLATLVHEMVHMEQYHFGAPGRGRYHNKQWADWMERAGLMPSSTGKKGGKKTGDSMSDYIIREGRFDLACKKLISKAFEISWYDRAIFRSPAFVQASALQPVNYGEAVSLSSILHQEIDIEKEISKPVTGNPVHTDASALLRDQIRTVVDSAVNLTSDMEAATVETLVRIKPDGERQRSKNKAVYQCPGCLAKVWGRPHLDLRCNACSEDFVEL